MSAFRGRGNASFNGPSFHGLRLRVRGLEASRWCWSSGEPGEVTWVQGLGAVWIRMEKVKDRDVLFGSPVRTGHESRAGRQH